MKLNTMAHTILIAGTLASTAALAAPQGDSLARQMGGQVQQQQQEQTMDQARSMEQTRERKQLRIEDGSGEQYRNQNRNEYRKHNGDMEMNGGQMGGSRMGGGAGKR